MTALPVSTDFTGASVTEAQFKTAITALRDYLSGQFGTAGDVATALATLGALGSSTVAKTAAYTVVATDRGKLITCSGTFTLSLTAAATLADGFSFAVANIGTGTITIDPSSTELIDGEATVSLGAGETCVVACTGGTAFRTVGKPTANGELRSQQVFTASGTWTKPAGLKRVKVCVVGAGGGSGAADGTSSNPAYSSPGSGGGWSEKLIEAAALGATETVTVGAGGTGGTTTSGSGGNGGTSSFGAHCSATGGGGGVGALDVDKSIGAAIPGVGSGGNTNGRGHDYHSGTTRGGASKFGPGASSGLAADLYGTGGPSRYSTTTLISGIAGAGGICIVEEFF